MAIAKPAAPTGVTATRVSDTQQNITWVNTSPTNPSAPYQFIDLYRSTNDGPDVYLASPGVVTSYTDRGTTGNRKYRYSVRARNSAGASALTYGSFFTTTPAAPTGVTAVRSAANDIYISWQDNALYEAGFEVSHSENGGAWAVLANVGAVVGYTHAAPNSATTHQYRVRAKTTTPVLFSVMSLPSAVVQVLGAPNAPTGLSPVGGVRDGATPITLGWVHNPTDTMPQSKNEVQWRTAGRVNALTNPSFETSLSGWVGNGATISRDTTLYTTGSASLKMVTATAYGSVDLTQVVAVTPGDAWTVSMDVRGSGTAQLYLDFTGDLGGVVTEAALTSSTWQRISVTGHAPAGTTNVRVSLIQTDSGTKVINVDGVLLEKSDTAGTYVEGGGTTVFASLGVASSSAQSRVVSAGTWANGSVIEWQVRTWGNAFTAPSPWSATSTLTLSSVPLVSLVYPAGSVGTSTLSPAWTFFDAGGQSQSGWTIKLYNSTMGVIETQSGFGPDTSAQFATPVQNGVTYTVGVSVRGSGGLWSAEARNTFTVVFVKPPTPTLAVTWNLATASALIQVTNPPTGSGQVDALYVQVWRLIAGDPAGYRLVATGLPLGATITDYIPALGVVNTYKAVAISLTETSATSPLVTVTTSGAAVVAVSGGPGFTQSVFVQSNIKLGLSPSRAKVLREFAGRTKPVEFVGEQRNRDITLSATIFRDSVIGGDNSQTSSWEAIEALSGLPAPACIRDCDGRRYFVSMGGPQFGTGAQADQSLSWSFTEIDYAEQTETQQ